MAALGSWRSGTSSRDAGRRGRHRPAATGRAAGSGRRGPVFQRRADLAGPAARRVKRYPAAAQVRRQQGVALLRFTMDRRGRVLSAVLEKSSGFDGLDQETLALIHRAEPLPEPPPEVPGDSIELTVPVQFFLTPSRSGVVAE